MPHSREPKTAVALLDTREHTSDHEHAVQLKLADCLAQLLHLPRAQPGQPPTDDAHYYYLATDTLIDPARYAPLGIHSERDLFDAAREKLNELREKNGFGRSCSGCNGIAPGSSHRKVLYGFITGRQTIGPTYCSPLICSRNPGNTGRADESGKEGDCGQSRRSCMCTSSCAYCSAVSVVAAPISSWSRWRSRIAII